MKQNGKPEPIPLIKLLGLYICMCYSQQYNTNCNVIKEKVPIFNKEKKIIVKYTLCKINKQVIDNINYKYGLDF